MSAKHCIIQHHLVPVMLQLLFKAHLLQGLRAVKLWECGLVDFQECLVSGRGWRRKELKRNACKFNDIAGALEAFQHSNTHRQRNHNCSGEIRPCQLLRFYQESRNFQSVLKSPAAGVIPLSRSLSFLLNEKECFQPFIFIFQRKPRGSKAC